MGIILSKKQIIKPFFSVNVTVLFADVPLSCQMLLLKIFHFLQVEHFLKLISLKFSSCCLPKFNLLQHFIRFSISKIQVQKPKLILISFHLFGAMITFWGLMKKTVNAYGLIQDYKESLLLRIFLTYWVRRVFILKLVYF